MQHFILSCIAALLFTQTATSTNFLDHLFHNQNYEDNTGLTESTTQFSNETEILNYNNGIYNSTSEFRSNSVTPFSSGNSLPSIDHATTDDNKTVSSELPNVEIENTSMMYASSSRNSDASTKETSNDSFSNHTVSLSESSSTINKKSQVDRNSTTTAVSPSTKINTLASSEADDDAEEVVIVKPTRPVNETSISLKIKTLYQRTLELISDTYTLSILLPVAAGVVFASTIILTISMCKCLQRRCRRNRFRRKALPDSVKNLRPSDHARLLAESSDEEF